jgi:beta-glucosidase
VLLFLGLTEQYETEGADRTDMKLPPAHEELLRQVVAVNPNVVVVLTAGAPVELPWIDQVKGLLATYTPGDGLGSATAKVLFGDVNPSGKLAETMPLKLEHNPSYLTFKESKRDIHYTEGVFVGYRWYEKRALPVAFPFGHGLSYTTFAYSNLTLSHTTLPKGETLTVTVDVTNTGDRAGKECVQIYVGDRESSLPRPVKELKGFQKLSLEPGETKTLTFALGKRAFAFYDTQLGDWAVEPGEFLISVGASSQDIRLTAAVEVEDQPWRPLVHVTQETTLGELVDDPRTLPLISDYLSQSPMYRPAEQPEAPDFLRNLPLWTVNHMAGRPVTPELLQQWIAELNQALGAGQ